MDNTELSDFLSELHERLGYDFSGYSSASLQRRLERLILIDKLGDLATLRYRVFTDKQYIHRFVEELTVNVTEMFRDPSVYLILKNEVLPALAKESFIKIWHAGCSTGEEVYSMAILLQEAGLLERSRIYATDLNPEVISSAMKGIFPLSTMKKNTANYVLAGGKGDFSRYYTALYDKVIFSDHLKEKMIFSTHNLVSDHSFNEFDLILCRNVLIYFDKNLQHRVLDLFDRSLSSGGFLCLGSKETLRFSNLKPHYKQLAREKIWRKGPEY